MLIHGEGVIDYDSSLAKQVQCLSRKFFMAWILIAFLDTSPGSSAVSIRYSDASFSIHLLGFMLLLII